MSRFLLDVVRKLLKKDVEKAVVKGGAGAEYLFVKQRAMTIEIRPLGAEGWAMMFWEAGREKETPAAKERKVMRVGEVKEEVLMWFKGERG